MKKLCLSLVLLSISALSFATPEQEKYGNPYATASVLAKKKMKVADICAGTIKFCFIDTSKPNGSVFTKPSMCSLGSYFPMPINVTIVGIIESGSTSGLPGCGTGWTYQQPAI